MYNSKRCRHFLCVSLPRLRKNLCGKKIVQCHGAFDLVHIGHVLHFEEAKALGDVLVVTITARDGDKADIKRHIQIK